MKIKILRGFFYIVAAVGYIFGLQYMEASVSMIIRAAGGLVENDRGEVLFIYRRNKWDLPKGKIEDGELPDECALREVKEETGIRELELGSFLLITCHRYEEQGAEILKETHWYKMKAAGDQPMVPQLEEDITALKWVGKKQLDEMKQNTYPNILEVLIAGGH